MEEARGVRQMFDWVGRERVTIGEGCRRLNQTGGPTRTGKTTWDRSTVGGILKNPASMGAAAYGKTRQGPLPSRLRAQRGRSLQPRHASSSGDVPREVWIAIPVPAIVDADVFSAVQEQSRGNQPYAHQHRRGAKYLLQGLVSGKRGGYAFYGKGISHKAAQGKPRD